jgi:alanyl-tRNA synthetase
VLWWDPRARAGQVVGAAAKVCGGGRGGTPALAQAGGKDASKGAGQAGARGGAGAIAAGRL